MQNHNHIKLARLSCRKRIFLLAFFWISGLLLGVFAAYTADGSVFTMMRTGVFLGVSIVRSFVVYILPVVLTALASFLTPVLILPIAFSKAASFGFVSACISLAFSGAGWLVRPLVMFSDIASIGVMFWLWVRCMRSQEKLSPGIFLICILCIVAICIINYFTLLPLAARLAVH